MNHLQFLVDPAPDAIDVAADLILMLLTNPPPPYPVITTRTNPQTGQIEIIAEYGENQPSAPLLHPLKTVKNPSRMSLSPYRRKRRCTASARLETRH